MERTEAFQIIFFVLSTAPPLGDDDKLPSFLVIRVDLNSLAVEVVKGVEGVVVKKATLSIKQ